MINIFQSTFPRGERRYLRTYYDSAREFQSTFPRGERQHVPQLFLQPMIISIHVPAWGTTYSRNAGEVFDSQFQSTFPRGERPITISEIFYMCVFQSTFPRGERQ